MLHAYDLFAFDLDNTLIELPTFLWNLFHDRFGVPAETRASRYKAYKAGLLSYDAWVQADINDWRDKGKTRADFIEALGAVKPMRGALDLLAFLKKEKKKIVLISGSIDLAQQTLLPDVSFDLAFINRLSFSQDGRVLACSSTPYDFEGKAKALEAAATRLGIPLSRTVFVGDAENDIHALRLAGLGIAFNATSKEVRDAADRRVGSNDMNDVWSLFSPRRHERTIAPVATGDTEPAPR